MMMRRYKITTAVIEEEDGSRDIYGPNVERNGDGVKLYIDGDFIKNLMDYGRKCKEYATKIAEITESRKTDSKKSDEQGKILMELYEGFCKMMISGLPTNSRMESLVEIGEKKSEKGLFEKPLKF